MEDLSNPDSEIYKNTLNKQVLFIDARMATMTRCRYFQDMMGCCGEKEAIANHLNHGNAPNLIHQFFNFKATKCILCKGKKGEKINDQEIKQFERAHCNIYARRDLLMMAIDELYTDNTTSIRVGDILKLFILKHKICPIYMLCNICHNKYDN